MKAILIIIIALFFVSCSQDLTLQTSKGSKTFENVKQVEITAEYIAFTTESGSRQKICQTALRILSMPEGPEKEASISAYILEQQKNFRPGIVISYSDLQKIQ